MSLDTNLKKQLGIPVTESEKFHQFTKIGTIVNSDPATWPELWTKVIFKEYPRLDSIVLPKPQLSDAISLKKVLFERKSHRKFGNKTLTLQQISDLFYFSTGLKNFRPPWRGNRFYPSGGSRYPLEIYIVSINTELGRSILHYNVKHHSLEIIDNFKKIQLKKYFNFTADRNPALIVIFTASFMRTTIKYNDRGYRYVISETGNLSQNFYLLSTALDLACSACGYRDEKVNQLLDIDGSTETVVYTLVIGSKSFSTKI